MKISLAHGDRWHATFFLFSRKELHPGWVQIFTQLCTDTQSVALWQWSVYSVSALMVLV